MTALRLVLCSALLVPALTAQEKPPTKPTKAGIRDFGLGGNAGGKFGLRAGGRRRANAVSRSIAGGLRWLVDHQQPDGGFDAPGKGIGRVGITAACLLPFLGDGSTMRSGPHKDAVRNAVRWLRKQQAGSGAFSSHVVEHALATYAMAEACGLSSYRVLDKNVKLALAHLVAQQNDDGGWHHASEGKPSGAFTTCHAIIAYRSAVDFGLVEDKRPLERAEQFLAQASGADGKVAVADRAPLATGPRSDDTVVAAVLLARFFLGHDPKRQPWMIRAADRLAEHPPAEDPRQADQVFEYLAGYGLYQMGGRHWRAYSAGVERIVGRQRQDGKFKGSWDPLGAGAVQGGRLYSTALSVLTLEAFYRYTRLIR